MEVHFYDHSAGTGDMMDGELEFLCWGRISSVTKRHYIVDSWGDMEDEDRTNTDWHTIVRSTIIRITKLNRSH